MQAPEVKQYHSFVVISLYVRLFDYAVYICGKYTDSGVCVLFVSTDEWFHTEGHKHQALLRTRPAIIRRGTRASVEKTAKHTRVLPSAGS